MDWIIQRKRAFFVCCIAGLGGVFPDTVYIKGVITNTPLCTVLHEPWCIVLCIGLVIASLAGLYSALDIRSKK